ncbi:MAG: acyltransferase [Muribaculum sp.]|nr:acyltransferase [Muribaculum sp.]
MNGKVDEPLVFHSISHDNNMNVVRYYLSFCVLLSHAAILTGMHYPSLQSVNAVVGCFFALSGFLMFPSFGRHRDMKGYLIRRARKILPSYIFIVVLAAFGLVFVSQLSVGDYFCSTGLYKYLAANLTFLNFLHPDLPGVFKGANFTTDAVNGALWTMKGEWVCYLTVPMVYRLVGLSGRMRGLALLWGIVALCIVVRLILLSMAPDEYSVYAFLARQFGTVLVFFYVGALINAYWTAFLKYKWVILLADIIILALCSDSVLYYVVLQPFVAGSLVLWISLVGSWGAKLSRGDDISYDIYLFHFPVIQVAVYFGLPELLGPGWFLLSVVGATVVLAIFSWNVVARRFQPARR